jgi:predicted nucleic acid-binding protein
MNIFVDTSALLAVLNAADAHHAAAKTLWEKIITAGDVLLCHNYILVETSALASRRLGVEAVRAFERDVVPLLRVEWITRDIHDAAVGSHLAAARRGLSLVDCVSFEVMRRTGIETAFAFDGHFREYGYESI